MLWSLERREKGSLAMDTREDNEPIRAEQEDGLFVFFFSCPVWANDTWLQFILESSKLFFMNQCSLSSSADTWNKVLFLVWSGLRTFNLYEKHNQCLKEVHFYKLSKLFSFSLFASQVCGPFDQSEQTKLRGKWLKVTSRIIFGSAKIVRDQRCIMWMKREIPENNFVKFKQSNLRPLTNSWRNRRFSFKLDKMLNTYICCSRLCSVLSMITLEFRGLLFFLPMTANNASRIILPYLI